MTFPKHSELRRRAKARLAEQSAGESALSLGAAQRLVHELCTHQMELEIQIIIRIIAF